MPKRAEFEPYLDGVCTELTDLVREDATLHSAADFQDVVGDVLREKAEGTQFTFDGDQGRPQIFPDFGLGEFGVEVKSTKNDTWRSVANSVFEGQRSKAVKHVYVVFGKLGGVPEVRFARYDDCIVHVRTSHVPRFEVDLASSTSIFGSWGITYDEFSHMEESEKIDYIRRYARSRLAEGERLWWLDEESEPSHTVPISARLYTTLSMEEKRGLRAEAALLSPRIVAPSRSKRKYDDVALYLVTYHGVLAHQARDLFSAGSVALRVSGARGGNYLCRALQDLEAEMWSAAWRLPMALFEEYWDESPPPATRIRRWLEKADAYADGWTPSLELFQDSTTT
jgi:hypothetical protein